MTMTSVTTLYGELTGIEFRSLFSNGKTDGCLVTKPNLLKTPYGELIPQYEAEDMGRRSTKPLYFYKNGALKSIALQTSTMLDTPAGVIPAELVTFHKNGRIKRIFPLDGKLSGYWSWQNEFALAKPLSLDSPAGKLNAKMIGVQFYESGALKSITLWPGQTLTVATPVGEITVRKGLAFYESGEIRSFEPLKKVELRTPIGRVLAYDNEPNGIHGDINSVQLSVDGSIEAFSTVDHTVSVGLSDEKYELFEPGEKNNVCGDERKVSVPMKVRFHENRVIFHDNPKHSFELEKYRFEIKPVIKKAAEPAYSCG
ncbi:conserved hypothetical protein [Chlorobium phaeobacteroides DSM 266]|jgi:hypothetical protein|uniref:Uncharacterized protein n=2 Tax=Chlorobium phaeobacteroides TaxID=1096 RepID=A1BGQ5_CHLPD|nr:conserved hypothetical protein [Chlorobium phaeobacteroides DSM 266]